MQSKVVRMLALAFMLGGAGIGLAQQQPGQLGQPPGLSQQPGGPPSGGMPGKKSPPEKSKLESMLAEALKNNPDIRVAAANLTLAEAELNRTRLQVTQKVLTLYHAIQSQQATVDFEQKQYDRMQGLLKDRAIDSRLVEERFTKLTAAKAKLAELEAQMPGLLGQAVRTTEMLQGAWIDTFPIDEAGRIKQPDKRALYDELVRLLEQKQATTGPMADKIRKALQTPVTVDYREASLADVLRDLEKKAPGLSLRDRYAPRYKLSAVTLTFEKPIPVAAVLQALEDMFISFNEDRNLGLCFVVREYGILAIPRRELPPGALTVQEFLRQKPADEPRRQPSSGKNPPAENVEGVVKAVDASGLVTISIGSDAGLAKGHTLELFRLAEKSSESKYLGTIRILEAKAKEAVGQAVGRLTDKPRVGDRVASRLLGN